MTREKPHPPDEPPEFQLAETTLYERPAFPAAQAPPRRVRTDPGHPEYAQRDSAVLLWLDTHTAVDHVAPGTVNPRAGFVATVVWLMLVGVSVGLTVWAYPQIDRALSSPEGAFADLDWQQTALLILGKYILWIQVAMLLLVPAALATHYRLFGPKVFSHDGPGVTVFFEFTRINHWVAALSCTVLILTGLAIMGGGTPGLDDWLGGSVGVLLARHVHAATTVVFTANVVFMLVGWAGKMLPRLCDLRWLLIAGGYLTRKKRRIPAHMFNAGQKMWFWLSTVGGLVLAGSGTLMFFILGSREQLMTVALVHHAFAVALVVMFLVHVYMAVFAIQGSLRSMIFGTKSDDELDTMHSVYYDELKERGEL